MGDKRNYTDEHVKSLQGSVKIEHTLAKMGSKQLRSLFESDYLQPAINLFKEMSTDSEFDEFLTLPAYKHL